VAETEVGLVQLLVDGDACPVKDEIYVVATRYGIPVALVANAPLYVPPGFGVKLVVVTADIPLAARCLAAGARVLGTHGRPFTEDSIGGALATRELKSYLRESGLPSGGPKAISAKDRSRFLSKLDELVCASLRER
jgi:hypothetical protein